MSILLTEEEIEKLSEEWLEADKDVDWAKMLLKAQLKGVRDAFNSAGIYKIREDGAYFWNPQRFREFWQSLLEECE